MDTAAIKKALENKDLLIGKEEVLKALRAGKLAKVYLASNPESQAKEDVMHYAQLAKVEVEELPVQNDELGTLCRKPFAISMLGVAQ